MKRPSKRQLLVGFLERTGLRWLLTTFPRWQGVSVLAYHRIGDGSASLFDRGLWSATPDDFEEQIRYVKRCFDVITIDHLAEALRKGRGRFLLITFDDGYRDNYEQAFPILRSQGVGATFFVTSGFLDDRPVAWWDDIAWMVRVSPRQAISGGGWFSGEVVFDPPDREQAIRSLLRVFKALPTYQTTRYLDFIAEETGSGRCPNHLADKIWMTWDMVREMRRADMSIGGHTVSHPVLANLSRDEQRQEIADCAGRIAKVLGEYPRSMSYPVGRQEGFNAETQDCVTDCGLEYAFSYYGGAQTFASWNPLNFCRIPVDSDILQDEFRVNLMVAQWAR